MILFLIYFDNVKWQSFVREPFLFSLLYIGTAPPLKTYIWVLEMYVCSLRQSSVFNCRNEPCLQLKSDGWYHKG